jgi:CelD/BcsL family acetyltransferase involved in cellulose biosynthesis
MPSEILPLSDLVPRDIAAWEELAARAISPNPFMEPDYVLPATRAWQVDDVGILIVREGRDWVGAVPIREARSWRGIPGRCLTVWRHDYCYLGTPLIAGDDPAAAIAALLHRALKDSPCMALEWIDGDGPLESPLWDTLRVGSRPVVLNRFERAALRSTGGDVEVRVSGSSRRNFARRRRHLEREVGLLTTRDDSADSNAYRLFLAIERSGWKGEVGTAMLCRPGHGEFFVEVCRRFAEKGRLQLLSLANDEHTVAMHCDLIAGSTMFYLHGCFDETYGRYSPGNQLELELVHHVNAGGYQLLDSCTAPDNKSLNRLWPARRRLLNVVATARRVTAAPAYAKWNAVAAALPLQRKLQKPAEGVRGH